MGMSFILRKGGGFIMKKEDGLILTAVEILLLAFMLSILVGNAVVSALMTILVMAIVLIAIIVLITNKTGEEKSASSIVKGKVVCLCGSTKPEWRQKYREVLETMTLMGNAVFTVVWFRGDFLGDFEARRPLMEQVHYLKIEKSDVIVVIDRNAVGEHTTMEIAYAKSLGKQVYFFDEIKN
jgi:hypothetical protein